MTTADQITHEKSEAQAHIASALCFMESRDWVCAKCDLEQAYRRIDNIFLLAAEEYAKRNRE